MIGRLLRAWSSTGRAPGYLYRIAERLPLRGQAETTLPNGARMTCDLADHVQRILYVFGIYEAIEARLFARLVLPGMTVFDIGANVGQYTLLAATTAKQVHAFEPIPPTFARLMRNVEINGLSNAVLNQVAVWDQDTTLTLGLPREMAHNAGAFSVGTPDAVASFAVTAIRLDDYVRERGIDRVDVMKVDAEGAEASVFEGAREILSRDGPVILAEILPSRMSGDSAGRFVALFRSLGYLASRITGTPRALEELPLEQIPSLGQQNILLHRQRLDDEITAPIELKAALAWGRSRWKA